MGLNKPWLRPPFNRSVIPLFFPPLKKRMNPRCNPSRNLNQNPKSSLNQPRQLRPRKAVSRRVELSCRMFSINHHQNPHLPQSFKPHRAQRQNRLQLRLNQRLSLRKLEAHVMNVVSNMQWTCPSVSSKRKLRVQSVEISVSFDADFHRMNALLSRTRVGDPLGRPWSSR